MEKMKLNEILKLHKMWLANEDGGERANLRGADLSEANLSEADLRWADLSEADLRGADLSEADLRWADLRAANLSEADLRWASVANISGYHVISCQLNTSRKNNPINYWVDLDVITTGCFQGSLEALKKAVEKTHKDNERIRDRYYRVIKFIEDTVADYEEEQNEQ